MFQVSKVPELYLPARQWFPLRRPSKEKEMLFRGWYSERFWVIRRNYSFLLILLEWKVFLFLRHILKRYFHFISVEVVLFECSSEFCGNSTASLWFLFSPCQSESTPISLLQTYRSSVFCFTASFLRSC